MTNKTIKPLVLFSLLATVSIGSFWQCAQAPEAPKEAAAPAPDPVNGANTSLVSWAATIATPPK